MSDDGFIRVGKTGDFRKGRGTRVHAGDLVVAVFNLGDRWCALQDACPHMGASLADGRLDGNSVVCHWHDWKFDLDSGQGDMRQWACADVFEVRVVNDEVWVRPPEKPEEQPEAPQEEWIAWDPDRFFKKNPDDRSGEP